MNSIDRKLARCAREIDAAKPKGLSFDEFQFLPHDVTCVPYRGSQAVHVREKDCRQIKGAAPEPKSSYRCETCCDTFRVMTMVCYGGRPFEKEDDCPDCSTLEAQFEPKAEDGTLVIGMPYWCETIWGATFCLWLGDGWFGCTPSAKSLRDLFLNGKATSSRYKAGKHIIKVIRAATEAELVKP